MKLVLFAAAAILLAATSAEAAPAVTATLAAASAKRAIVTDHVVWKCDGTTCITNSVPRQAFTIGECRALAEKAGAAVAAFVAVTGSLDAESLTRCNTRQ